VPAEGGVILLRLSTKGFLQAGAALQSVSEHYSLLDGNKTHLRLGKKDTASAVMSPLL